MPDYDVGAVSLSVPPASAVVQSYRPAVLVKNNGIHDALAVGSLRIYDSTTGLLIFTTEIYSGVIAPSETKPAQAVDYWTPPGLGKFQIIAYVSCINDQYEPNNSLAPRFILVTAAPPPPPPPVTPHASQHEDGGPDELNLDGLPGKLAEKQEPTTHATEHGLHGSDEIDVNGLSGVLADPQTPTAHGNERHTTLYITPEGLAAHNSSDAAHDLSDNLEHTNKKGAANGYASLDAGTKVPALQLGGPAPVEQGFLRSDQTWQQVAAEAHHETHETGGDDELSIADLDGNPAARGAANGLAPLDADSKVPTDNLPPFTPTAHATSHQTGGDDELSIAGLSGEAADAQKAKAHSPSHEAGQDDELDVNGLSGQLKDAQIAKAHSKEHEAGGVDVINVNGLSGTLADPQDPTGHGANHSSEGLDPVNIGALQGVPACVGAASGAASLDETTKVPTAQLGGEGATASTFLRGDQTWATPPAQAAHKATHENGGADEISIAGLSGKAADAQNPVNHGASHGHEGGDDISIGGLSGIPAAAGVNGGLAELDNGGLVPAGQLGTGDPTGAVYLKGDRTWSGFIASPHASTHLPDGGDFFSHGSANHNNSEPITVGIGLDNAEGIAVQTVRADHRHLAPGGLDELTEQSQGGDGLTETGLWTTLIPPRFPQAKTHLRLRSHGWIHHGDNPMGLTFTVRFGNTPLPATEIAAQVATSVSQIYPTADQPFLLEVDIVFRSPTQIVGVARLIRNGAGLSPGEAISFSLPLVTIVDPSQPFYFQLSETSGVCLGSFIYVATCSLELVHI